jgi:hypothetical protein
VAIGSAFFIVTETCIYVAKAEDIMSGNAVFDKVFIPSSEPLGRYKSTSLIEAQSGFTVV